MDIAEESARSDIEPYVLLRPDLDPAKLDRTRELMIRAIRDCLVKGYEPLVDAVSLPDPDDRHILAAAIKAPAPRSS